MVLVELYRHIQQLKTCLAFQVFLLDLVEIGWLELLFRNQAGLNIDPWDLVQIQVAFSSIEVYHDLPTSSPPAAGTAAAKSPAAAG